AWMAAAPTEIKRELTNSKGMVRIMTVHGSKGLEAKIVILVDPGGAPVSAIHDPAFLPRERLGNPLLPPALVWLPTKNDRTPWHAEAIDGLREGQEEEYRRLLYVALTRAEDRLIVCGWEPKRGAHEACWYNIVARALKSEASELTNEAGDVVAWRWQKTKGEAVSPGAPGEPSQGAQGENSTAEAMPAWLTERAPAFVRKRRLQPSKAFEDMEAKDGVVPVSGASRLEARRQPAAWPLERGRLVHRLLEILPDLDEDRRWQAAERFVDQTLSEDFAGYRQTLLDDVAAILGQKEFQPLFGENARAEVSVVGTLKATDGSDVAVSGQIDRLVVEEDRVLIVDYKTNLVPPETAETVSLEYLAQLAVYRRLMTDIYPGKRIEAALLWTAIPSLMQIPENLLDDTFRKLGTDLS
uniref:PD-(D/E)XK nuclease family protein n=1 Tax=Roseibium sp. TaxID=1936156 RepID=UPI003A973D82